MIKPTSKVQVFGSFSRKPWAEKIPCVYDPYFKCFKTRTAVPIKQGQVFKFIIDEGKMYVTSNRYATQRDNAGLENNVYDPKRI